MQAASPVTQLPLLVNGRTVLPSWMSDCFKTISLFSFFLNLLSEKQSIFLLCIKYLLFRNNFYWVLVPCAYVRFFYLNASLSSTHFSLGTGKTKDTPHFEVLVRVHTLPNLWAPMNCASILFGAPAVGGIFFLNHDMYYKTKTLM